MKFDKTLKMINNSKRLVERKLSAHLWLQIMAIRRCTSSPTLISIPSQARLPSRWQLVTRFLFLSTSSKPISWKLLMKISQCSLSKFKGGRLWFHPNSAWEMEYLRRSKTVLRTCDSCSTRSNKHLKKSFNKSNPWLTSFSKLVSGVDGTSKLKKIQRLFTARGLHSLSFYTKQATTPVSSWKNSSSRKCLFTTLINWASQLWSWSTMIDRSSQRMLRMPSRVLLHARSRWACLPKR